MAGSPQVSVVVATRDRPRRLAALLAALRAQRDAPPFEVVVADDASGPETAAVLQAERAQGAFTIEVVRMDDGPRGPGTARNAAWRAARAPLVAFTDDDCRPAPGWLAALAAAHRREPRALVQGRTEPDPEELGGSRLTAHTVRAARLGPRYETCNILYPRELLEELDGFDDEFHPHAGEDTDLAWRAFEAGRPGVFAAGAVVRHAVERLGPRATLERTRRWTGTVRLFRDHPGARSALHHGLFWNEWHYLLARSALALALPLPRWLRAVVLARHALALRDRTRALGAGPAAAGFLVVYDCFELAAVARGALRHRTTVL